MTLYKISKGCVLDGLYTGPNAITFGFNTFHDIHQIPGQITDI